MLLAIVQQALAGIYRNLISTVWVIDGVNEMDPGDQDLLIGIIEELAIFLPGLKVLLLSRNKYDMQRRLSGLTLFEITFDEKSNRDDLKKSIDHWTKR